MKIAIIDGYVDEPACFGVPPYISPYIRYIAGALVERGIGRDNISYFTIDGIRNSKKEDLALLGRADLVVILSGMTVPGKYLRSSPITLKEIEYLCRTAAGVKVIGGPIRLGYSSEGGMAASTLEMADENVFVARQDIEAFVHDIIAPGPCIGDPDNVEHRMRTVGEIGRWADKGAFIIRQHPDFPNIMCEMETYRGCGRDTHCSFCTEFFYGPSTYRSVEDVVAEAASLYKEGALYFRLGRQPDLFTYHAVDSGDSLPRPNPQALESLYSGIRKVAPGLEVLHMDNANPATIATYPDECSKIMKTILKYHTPGDVAAMGMESADPAVIRANNLKAMPDDVFEAVELMNEIGSIRGSNGLSHLLPGLNFVHGLAGETKKTFGLNYDFLKNILDDGLLLRRINIRQVMPFSGTPVAEQQLPLAKNRKMFLKYKEKVRKDIDLPMLKRVVPEGTVLKDVLCEVWGESSVGTFGRQLGSYPILVGISEKLPIGKFVDVRVTGHGFRSISATVVRE
jgi:radical SAM superfamily enzyme with C-terminal helix-hairpin-helix motif